MSDTSKPDIKPPVIVIDSFDDYDNYADDEADRETDSNNAKKKDDVIHTSSTSENDPQDEERELSTKNVNSNSQNDNETYPHTTLQVPPSLPTPIKSSLKLAEGMPSAASQRTGHVTISFGQNENGIVKGLSRHNSRETLREVELQHLKEEVCHTSLCYHTYLKFTLHYVNTPMRNVRIIMLTYLCKMS